MSRVYVDGLAESLGGDAWLSAKPIVSGGGKVWYVNSVTGADGAQTDSNKNTPFATLAFAVTQSTGLGDIFVLESGHSEAIGSTVTVPSYSMIIGVGSTGGVPGATLTVGTGGLVTMTNVGSVNSQIRNVRFASRSVSGAGAMMTVLAPDVRFSGCRFELGDGNLGGAVTITSPGGEVTFDGCTFVQTGANRTSGSGIKVLGTPLALTVLNSTFDGGAYGWGKFAVDANSTSFAVKWLSNTLLRGSDINLLNCTAWVGGGSATGGGEVIL